MIDKLINDLTGSRDTIQNLDTSQANLTKDHKTNHASHLDVVNEFDDELVNVLSKVERFYNENSAFRSALNNIKNGVVGFKAYYNETHFDGSTVAGLQGKAVNTINNMMNELSNYGPPSEDDPKVDE